MAFASGISGLLTLAIEVHKICVRYTIGVKKASKTVQMFLSELNALKRVLIDVQDIADQINSSATLSIDQSMSTSEALESSQECSSELDSLLKQLRCKAESMGSRFSLKPLTWPLSENRTRASIDLVRRCVETFRTAMQVDTLCAYPPNKRQLLY